MDRDDTLPTIEYQTRFAGYTILITMAELGAFEFVLHGGFRFSDTLFGKSRFVGDKRD